MASVVALPFADTFESPARWLASGAWQFDTKTAYDGSGWLLNGAAREMTSILELIPAIDLTGTLSAQLLFRQRGYLPDSDFVAIDLSLDGGVSWFMIDQQIGLETDWTRRIVDLTSYRGQVIRLRIRASAGSADAVLALSPDTAFHYRIDNLALQFVFIPPAIQFAALDTTPRTLMGLHLVVGARKEPILSLAKQLRAIGRPLGTLKGTSGTEDILRDVKAISPETIIVYRSLLTPEGQVDCPNASRDPISEARIWIAGLQPYWQSVRADYYEVMNECQPPVTWLVPFSIEAMRVAGQAGQCLLLFSFSVGNPEPEYFAQLRPVFDYILQNPCQPGRYHGIALHAYGVNGSTLVSESGITLGFRHRMLLTPMLAEIPEAIRIPVYLTEAGPGDGSTEIKCEDVVRDVIQYTRQLEFDPYVRGFHLWNVGTAGDWVDFTSCLPMIESTLVQYYSSR